VEGAPTEEPRSDASNARSQRPRSRSSLLLLLLLLQQQKKKKKRTTEPESPAVCTAGVHRRCAQSLRSGYMTKMVVPPGKFLCIPT
jgi:hypothetical protein